MKKLKKLIKIIIILLLLIVLMINLSIIIQTKMKPNTVPSVFGMKPFIVLSGSMESQISVGDLVIVKEIEPNLLKIGDIIAYRDSEDIVTTHRIVDILAIDGKLYFTTKGDANNVNDNGNVSSDMVEGKYQTKFAKVGNIILFIQQPMGFAVMMLSIFVICVFIYLYQDKKINKETRFKDEEEKQAFEDFLKERERRKEDNTNK